MSNRRPAFESRQKRGAHVRHLVDDTTMNPRRRKLERSEARAVFNRYDRNNNANIDKNEFRELSSALGAPLSPEELDAAWSEIDADQNGRVSFDEFFTWWSSEG
jgi:Ca2+-binding EF-hand superfamily protein